MLWHNEKYLSGYVDGQLTEEQKMSLENHLKSCKECSTQLKTLQKLKSDMFYLSETSKPAEVSFPLRYSHKEVVPPRIPVYETIAYKLGLAFFMNGFMLKFESFSTTWVAIFGLYALFHLFLYMNYNIRKTVLFRHMGLA